jgi:hypothetical protein
VPRFSEHGDTQFIVAPGPDLKAQQSASITRVDIPCVFEDNASLAKISAGQHTKEMTNGNCKKSVSKS